MTYSCTDFADSILDALHITVPDEDSDNPSAQADLALAEIERLQRLARVAPLPTMLPASQHTPGPWTVDGVRIVQDAAPVYVGGGQYSRAVICSLHLRVPVINTLAGDSALIAAAPDLLAALRALVLQANQGVVLERDACTRQARAAIAKAEGRS